MVNFATGKMSVAGADRKRSAWRARTLRARILPTGADHPQTLAAAALQSLPIWAAQAFLFIRQGSWTHVRVISLQKFVPRGLRVHVVSPGSIRTSLEPYDNRSAGFEATMRLVGSDIPQGRLGMPKEIATVDLILALSRVNRCHSLYVPLGHERGMLPASRVCLMPQKS